MRRLIALIYGMACYTVFFITLLYAIGFMGNFIVPKSIDSGPSGSLTMALAVDGALLALFAVQHSVMARPWFKRVWTRVVAQPVERSTYVLSSSLALLFMFWQWRPIGGVLWNVQGTWLGTVLTVSYVVGLLIVLLSTFLINHFDLFGLRQVFLHYLGRSYTQLEFRTPVLYRFVRHPLYVGWVVTFWSAPVMTSARLLFAVMTTAYILVAIQFEERDLIAAHGEKYRSYRKQVPMIIPAVRPRPISVEQAAMDRSPMAS